MGCSQIVAGKRDGSPSVDAAHAVNGYLLDEQLIRVDEVFLLQFKGVVGHFHQDLSRRADTLVLSNIGVCSRTGNSLTGQ